MCDMRANGRCSFQCVIFVSAFGIRFSVRDSPIFGIRSMIDDRVNDLVSIYRERYGGNDV